MAGDVMSVRLHLPQIRVLGVVEDTVARLVVAVESSLRRLRCPNCGFRCHRVHDRRDKKVTDLEVSGRPVTLVWSRRRMVCDVCGSRFLEDHHAFEGALTARLARVERFDLRDGPRLRVAPPAKIIYRTADIHGGGFVPVAFACGLEEQWSPVEKRGCEATRGVLSGSMVDDDRRAAILELMALHLLRSSETLDRFLRMIGDTGVDTCGGVRDNGRCQGH